MSKLDNELVKNQSLLQDAVKIYTYAYPIVWTKQVLSIPAVGYTKTSHVRELAKADGVSYKPNNDTLYSFHALQLKSTPFVVDIPKLPDNRYLLVDILDIETNVVFATGSKSENNGAGKYLVLFRDQDIPQGYEEYQTIRLKDSLNFLLIRTETSGGEDYQIANQVQDSFDIHPLYPEKLVDTGFPIKGSHLLYVENLTTEQFYEEFRSVLPDILVEDEDIERILDEFGFLKKEYSFEALSVDFKEALIQGAKVAYEEIKHYAGPAIVNHHWKTYTTNIGDFGKDYLLRAFTSWFAWGANLPEDSIYPLLDVDSSGNPLFSDKDYQIHFEKDGLPRAKYFWSLTVYGEPGGTLVDNPFDKYVINSHWIDQLQFNQDGSLDITLSRTIPDSEEKRTNWLPLPADKERFSLLLRLYGADEKTLNGEWDFPIVSVL